MAGPKFPRINHSFHSELKKRIHQYFQQARKKTTGNAALFSKAFIIVTGFIAIYIHLVFFTPAGWIACTECIVLAVLTAAIGFNVMHDGVHGSFSSHKWVNKMAGLSLNFLGANNFMWRIKHNIIHHTYTNIHTIDDDIEAKPLLRFCRAQKYYKVHRFQHWYFWAAYSLLYLWWVFFTDYKKYFLKRIGSTPIGKMNLHHHISFWLFKIFHVIVFILLPVYMVGFLPWLSGFLIYALVSGFVLSIIFQLAHTVEDTSFPDIDKKTNSLGDEWALHQLKTTANFATRNKFLSWWVGGLNFQIEHHLFPKVSHIHYPAISKIIKSTCKDFGFPYIEYPKIRLALISHIHHLKNLSRK